MPLAHRETVDEQGVEAVLLDVGAVPRRAPAPARPGDRRSASSSSARARACTTSPTGSTTSRRRWRSSRAQGGRADRLRAAHRDPPKPGRVRPPAGDRLGADGDRRARGGRALMAEKETKVEIGFGIGQVLSVKLDGRRARRPAQGGRGRQRAGTTCAPRRARLPSTWRPSSSSASTTARTRSASPARRVACADARARGRSRQPSAPRSGGARTRPPAPTASGSGSRRRTR